MRPTLSTCTYYYYKKIEKKTEGTLTFLQKLGGSFDSKIKKMLPLEDYQQ